MQCPWRLEEGTRYLGARIIGIWETPDMGAGTQTQFSSIQEQQVPTWPPVL